MRRLTPALLTALLAASCGQSSSDPTDSGASSSPDVASAQPADTGVLSPDAAADAPDAASMAEDVGAMDDLDAAAGPLDADVSPGADAATVPPDAGLPAGPDAGTAGPFCAVAYAGCDTFVDATAAGANRTVSFTNFEYTPKCLRIAAGQSVTFTGSFSVHPLKQACGPATTIAATSSGSSKSFVFDAPGDYGYFCTVHGTAGGGGMAGSILVE